MNKIKNLREIIDVKLLQNPRFVAYQIREGEGAKDITNRQFYEDVRNLAAKLLLFKPECCALVGENSYKWQVAYFAVIYTGAVVVPIDKDLSSEEIDTIISAAKCNVLIWGESYEDVARPILAKNPKIGSLYFQSDKSVKIQKGSIEAAIEDGKEIINRNLEVFDKITVDSSKPATYVFTSGTTGTSKGVMLSHYNLISDIYASLNLNAVGEKMYAILPMNHTFQSTLGCMVPIMNDTTISINNSIKFFAQNLKIFKPTDLACVPLVMDTMHQNIWNTIRESGKEKSVRSMMKITRFLLNCGIDVRKRVFKKIHDSFGGNFKSFFCGGALLNETVARDMNDFGFNVYIGYGITECSPLIGGNLTNRYSKFGSCGFPISCNEIRLMNTDANGDGEIWVKGANVMIGYLDNPEATDEVLYDGWFKTGDLGRKDKDGFLYITGRKKNLIVLNNGKNVYPEELEGFVQNYPIVKEVIVFGKRDKEGAEAAVSAEIFPDLDYASLNNIIDVEAEVKRVIEEVNIKLPYYKRIVGVSLRDSEFEKTTTKKIKRHKL